MRAGPRVLVLCLALLALAGSSGCFLDEETRESGAVGDKLTADDLEVTVERIDRETRVPDSDITGLSVPGDGYRLVGMLVNVCSDHGSAIGPWHFKLETSAGEGRPKYTANNYRRSFDSLREGCKRGWIVYEIPRESSPTEASFAFDHSGRRSDGRDNLSARFEWKVG